MAKENSGASVEQAAVYSKEALLKSAKYAKRRDLLSVLLEDGKSYTFESVENKIDKFMKGQVK